MLNAKGREVVQKVETSCIVELALADPFGRLNDLTTVPDMIKDPRCRPGSPRTASARTSRPLRCCSTTARSTS